MNTQENILVKANIQKEGNSKRIKIIFVVYQSLLVFLLMIGLISGSYSTSLSKTIGWFDVSFYYYNVESGYYSPYTGSWIDTSGSHIYEEEIIAVTVIFLVLCSIPLLLEAVQKRQRQNTSLTISDSAVYDLMILFYLKRALRCLSKKWKASQSHQILQMKSEPEKLLSFVLLQEISSFILSKMRKKS